MRAFILGILSLMLAGCSDHYRPRVMPGGDAALGKRLIDRYQCGACHVIPGIPAARGRVGPPLAKFGRRAYIAGSTPNQPDALIRWLIDPPAMKPGTLMPDLGITEQEARHIGAYLYSGAHE